LAVDALHEERNGPRPGDLFFGDHLRIGMAAGTGFVNLRAMGGRHRIAVRFDGVGRVVARGAGWQMPGFLPAATGMNAGGHMFRLAAMARSAEADVAIGGYLLDSVTTMTGDAIGAGAYTPQIGMSAIRNILMGFEMAGAATYWLGRFGVRPFWDATMALGAGKLFVRGLNQVGRLYEQRSVSPSPDLLLQVWIVMAGQALL
jgi:hypothetical protein